MKSGSQIAWMLTSLIGAAACGGAGAPADKQREAAHPVDARSVSPFVLQFTGEYTGVKLIEVLALKRDGTYTAKISGLAESGRYDADFEQKELPIVLRLSGGSGPWTVLIESYDGTLRSTYGGETANLSRPLLGPDEELCDRTEGLWLDDDPDPFTGLFCACGPARLFIPSAGGCVL